MKKMIDKIRAQIDMSGTAMRENCSPVLFEDYIKRTLARNIADQLLDNDSLPVLNTRDHRPNIDRDIFGMEICIIDDDLYRLITTTGDYRFWSMLSQIDSARLNAWMLTELTRTSGLVVVAASAVTNEYPQEKQSL